MSKDTFTGKSRFRVHKQWRKPDVLVLQAQFIGDRISFSSYDCRRHEYTYWADVKPEWMLGLSIESELNLEV